MVHVNDLLFRDGLCTFPILSRKACLAVGICPACYRRYRIDDHIGDTYHLLSYLGHNRRTYLEDVVFEHNNYGHRQPGPHNGAAFFESREGKIYIPKPEVFGGDSQAFNERLEDRKRNALTLAGLIESAAEDRRQAAYAARLQKVQDSQGYRLHCPAAKKWCATIGNSRSPRVTVAVVTSNLRRSHASKCLSQLKKHTSDFDLIVLDNNGSKAFNHACEMNRALRAAKTDYVVLLDDDVFVTPGWLEGMKDAVDERTAVVTPLHRDRRGRASYSGVYLLGDGSGRHAHTIDVPDSPRITECICSAATLIDRRKCDGIFFGEIYRKYFLDLDYALQVWEAGWRVVCTPSSSVTHWGGGTMSWRSAEAAAAVERNGATFAATWIASGRLAKIQKTSGANTTTCAISPGCGERSAICFGSATRWRRGSGSTTRITCLRRFASIRFSATTLRGGSLSSGGFGSLRADSIALLGPSRDRSLRSGSRLRRLAGRVKRETKRIVTRVRDSQGQTDGPQRGRLAQRRLYRPMPFAQRLPSLLAAAAAGSAHVRSAGHVGQALRQSAHGGLRRGQPRDVQGISPAPGRDGGPGAAAAAREWGETQTTYALLAHRPVGVTNQDDDRQHRRSAGRTSADFWRRCRPSWRSRRPRASTRACAFWPLKDATSA